MMDLPFLAAVVVTLKYWALGAEVTNVVKWSTRAKMVTSAADMVSMAVEVIWKETGVLMEEAESHSRALWRGSRTI